MATQTLTRHLPTDHRQVAHRSTGLYPAPPPVADTGPAALTASPAQPKTAAGARAMQRRRARVAADRRPPSGLVPSGGRTAAVVCADRAAQVADCSFPMGRWSRLVCTVSLVATAVLVGVTLVSSDHPGMFGQVTVGTGDSLWSIARKAEPGADPRPVIDQIRQLNHLTSDAIPVGLVLMVPTQGR